MLTQTIHLNLQELKNYDTTIKNVTYSENYNYFELNDISLFTHLFIKNYIFSKQGVAKFT